MDRQERLALERAVEQISEKAESFGLRPFTMHYEICPADVIYAVGAYGMPTRFSHWSFGKAFQRMKMQYDTGLNKIYELVVNNDPCYAFLLESNTLLQNKVIVAHVLAHSDFFRNNVYFSTTPRDMVERMAVYAERIRRYELQHGQDAVEAFLDDALVIHEHVAPPSPVRPRFPEGSGTDRKKRGSGGGRPEDGEKEDVVQHLIDHSPVLEDWQRDILAMLREEMRYFWPQLETKIMNEGWATYWHLRIMREMELTPEEAVEFARMHSQVTQRSPRTLNPYRLGLAVFESLEGDEERLFEVREVDSDVSFLRNYLTKELVEAEDLYIWENVRGELKVTDRDWKRVRDTLVAQRVHGGLPTIVVWEGEEDGPGDLWLRHRYEGVELDGRHLKKALVQVRRLWGRDVHLDTVVDGRPVRFTCRKDGVQSKVLE
ncbi:MAG: SpoVR family protein [Alicyclobacillaceae bacterium]|nr:SpoVR family protein [Alicyclobacillaceae bacterium]